MSSNKNLMTIIKKIIEQSNIGVRGFKGYGASTVILDRTPTFLGKSATAELIDNEDIASKQKEDNFKKVKVSRAFHRDRK